MADQKSIQEFLSRFGLPEDARAEVEGLIRDQSVSSVHRPPIHATLGPDAPRPITLLPHQLFQTWFPDPGAETMEAPPEGDAIQRERFDDGDRYELTERFHDIGPIGTGGMGEVRRALDRDLNRVVALKIIRPELMRNPRAVARFVEEAQTTGQLQHPGIVPVHEMGRLMDGRLYFTMLEVRGRSFDAIIHDYHQQRREEKAKGVATFSFRRVVDIFFKVCEAVAYAHARGVIHRDLKPTNVLVGAFGEVHVVDWGLAKIIDRPDALADLDPEERVVTNRSQDSSKATLAGTIAGTPAYMPLEQAMGLRDKQGPHSDVYALGAMLYEVLTGEPPYRGETAEHVLRQVLQGAPPTPDDPQIPPELLEICQKAMERDPELRYPNGRAIADEVSAWLDGAKRREHALELVAQARGKLNQIRRLRDRAKALRREAESYLEELTPTDPVEVKRIGWRREEEAKRLEQGADVLEVVVTQLGRAALEHVPQLPEAHAFLADFYALRHADAEDEGDLGGTEQYKVLLRAHDSGRYARYLKGDGALTLITEPPDAKVEIYRYEEEDRRFVEVPRTGPLRTPLREVELPMGSYMLVLKGDYRPPVRYPVHIGRNEHWDGKPPGASAPEPIYLPKFGELRDDDIYVPAGWMIAGGDRLATNGLPRRRVWTNAFVVKRYPVTNREYMEFLDDLVGQRRLEDALRFAPRARGGTFGSEGPLVYGQDTNGLFYLATDPDGNRWGRDWPVVLISWHGANAFASWRSVQDGYHWRLPTEYEWEKSARGVDGRHFPWGNYLDPTWCCMRESHLVRALPETVEGHPSDESPYGVRGMGGNVRDWCRNYYTLGGPPVYEDRAVITPIHDPDSPVQYRTVRGGSWDGAANDCRTAFRYGYLPENRLIDVGFRLVRPYEPDTSKKDAW